MTAEERRQSLARLVAQDDDHAAEVIGAALRDSHWPACDELAAALAQTGTEAAKVQLLSALKARRHHVRSAAVKALATLGGDDVREAVLALVGDPSYEVRQDVEEALRQLGEQGQRHAR